jgi:hypothetical protein
MRDAPGTSFTPTSGGWVRVGDPASGLIAWVRFDKAPDGRLRPGALVAQAYVRGSDGRLRVDEIRGAALRGFPIAEAEAAANGPLRDKLLAHLDEKVEVVFQKASGEASRSPGRVGRPVSIHPSASSLSVPKTRPYPDEFYAAVADLYKRDASVSHRPAAWIAEQNGVSVAQVHRWVAEARRRGLLPPGRPGKAG